MDGRLAEALKGVVQQPQRQDSTDAQLRDLMAVTNLLGLYDAADVLRTILSLSEGAGRGREGLKLAMRSVGRGPRLGVRG